MDTAIKIHSVAKAKDRKKLGAVPFVYEYLSDALSLPTLGSHQQISKCLEAIVKGDCSSYPFTAIIDMMEQAGDFKECTIQLLSKHLYDIDSEKSIDVRELQCRFSRMAEKELNIKDSNTFASLKLLLRHAYLHITQFSVLQKEIFFIESASFWKRCKQYSGGRKTELMNNDVIKLMHAVLIGLCKRAEQGYVTVCEYHQLDDVMKKCNRSQILALIRLINPTFEVTWDDLNQKLQAGRENVAHLESLLQTLSKLSPNGEISGIDKLMEEMNIVNDKFHATSSKSIGEIPKPGFYGVFQDLIPIAEIIYPFRALRTFLTLSVRAVENIETSDVSIPLSQSTSADDSLGATCAILFEEQPLTSDTPAETTSSRDASVVAYFLANSCVDQYRGWVEGVTFEATLDHVTKYIKDYKVVCSDLQVAAKIFELKIPSDLLKALSWLENLSVNEKRVKSIQKCILALNVKNDGTQLGKNMEVFLQCLSNSKEVTVFQLTDVMNTLEALLRETTEDWWDTLQQISTATDLIKFLRESVDDDFKFLIDAVEERSEQAIDESTVSNLIKVKQLLQPVMRQSFNDPVDFLDCLKRSLQKEGKGMSLRVCNCAHHLHSLKALYQHVANRGELTKEIIANALEKGTYKWCLQQGSSVCFIKMSYKITKKGKSAENIEKSTEMFNADGDALNDLKSRALLLAASDKQEEEGSQKIKKTKDSLQNFISIIALVHEIGTVVTELHNLGHFGYRTYQKTAHSSKSIQSELHDLLKGLQIELSNWKKLLEECRMQFFSLNFLFSDQLSLVSSFLTMSADNDLQRKMESILYFVHPGATIDDVEKYRVSLKPSDITLRARLEFIGSSLDKVKRCVKCSRKLFPQSTELAAAAKNLSAVVHHGLLYIVHLEIGSTQSIPVLLSLYVNSTGCFPLPSEVLFCHSSTTWEEVHLLIQRCLKSSTEMLSELHCLANVEKLPNALQYQLVEELGKLLVSSSDGRYRLAVICRGGAHHPIIDHFSSYVHRVQGLDTAMLNNCLQKTWNEIVMVSSTVPGLGKTEQIKTSAAYLQCRLKSVHISGPVTRDSLVASLNGQNIRKSDILHLDVAEVDDAEFLDACLFEFIVLGCLSSGTNIAYLPTGKVYVEVANTVGEQLKNSLVVLSCFKLNTIKWKQFADYIVSKEIDSPVQIVCQYLSAMDAGTLDSKDIPLSGPHIVAPLVADVCKGLLQKHFSETEDISFSVAEIFLNVFSGQLQKLSCSKFFVVSNLKAMLGSDKNNDVRSQLVKALMVVAKDFACRSVQSCRSKQTTAQLAATDEKHSLQTVIPVATKIQHKASDTMADIMVKRIEGMLRWADSNHLLIVFHSDSQTVSPLYSQLSLVPDHIKALFKTQGRNLVEFATFSRKELYTILGRLAGVASTAVQADESYALTTDNLLKMVLILLRVRANIPIVVMGETGCGKTSLVRFLADTCDTDFRHFNIHAGINVDAIKSVVEDCNVKCVSNPRRQLWLFLDEINTCDHMGLLTEIICHRSCLGKPLAMNLVLIAACNPYRLREESHIATAGLEGKLKLDEYTKLVYRVHPLPETMIDYVWDYGTLHPDDEKSYIKQMVQKVFPGQDSIRTEWLDKISKLLVMSQEYIQKVADNEWCVSLRDVNRCRILIDYFYNMLKSKTLKATPTKKDYDVTTRCIILALSHCYQSRLGTSVQRRDYWRKCSTIIFQTESRHEELSEIVREEQMDLLDRMELPQGIAKNTALCENVFVILICILNRIPIFLVGKPGCSKSLSVQLIRSNIRGKDSQDKFFQTLPNLYIVSYQGSESSTSEGIIKVFEKAEKYRKANEQENVLPVVLLDEVGLAEASKFNPLKVLHSLLEPATGELPSVAVVGISNWSLDAAKMNRAIHLSRPDMDAHELYETGVSISLSPLTECDDVHELSVNRKILRALADAYFEYQCSQSVKNFHGLRDYYSLIKYISRLFQESTDDTDETVIQKGLLRNFGGLSFEVNDIIKKFLSAMKETKRLKWRIEDIIQDNLKDRLARHLMIITSGDSGLGILQKSLAYQQRKLKIIFGSRFSEDQTEDYSYQILNQIILCMESGSVLVLKDLDSIYGSLYDMLNQNYTVVGNKKNCRIALGPYSNPMCQVHDDFRCIVFVDQHKVDFSDPPFLNRFEKQLLRFEDIIGDQERQLITELQKWVKDFSSIVNLPFKEEHAFVGLNGDTIPSLVYQLSQNTDISTSKLLDECKSSLLWLAPPDALLRVAHSQLSQNSQAEVLKLQKMVFSRPVFGGLSNILIKLIDGNSDENLPPKFAETFGLKLVVYTFSNIHVNMQFAGTKLLPFRTEKLGAFKSEKQLTKTLKEYFESSDSLLILQCQPNDDGEHIPLAKFLLQEMQQEHRNRIPKKHICLVLHMERSSYTASSASWQFSFLSGWQLVMIDSIEEQYPLVSVDNELQMRDDPALLVRPLLESSVTELLQSDFQSINTCIRDNLIWAFTCTSSCYGERSIQQFSDLILNIANSDLISCLAATVLEKVKQQSDGEDDAPVDLYDPHSWHTTVACDMYLLNSSTSFVDALKHYLTQCVTTPLANIVYRIESLSAWNSYFTNEQSKSLWEVLFRNMLVFNLQDDYVQGPHGVGSFKITYKPFNLQCPFSQCYIIKMLDFEDHFRKDFLDAKLNPSNLTDDEELSEIAYMELFQRYKMLFYENVFEQLPDVLSSHKSEFITDICNYMSRDQQLDEEVRVSIVLWFCRFKSHVHYKPDPLTEVTETILCIWQYEELHEAILQLLVECHRMLPCSIKEMLVQIGADKKDVEAKMESPQSDLQKNQLSSIETLNEDTDLPDGTSEKELSESVLSVDEDVTSFDTGHMFGICDTVSSEDALHLVADNTEQSDLSFKEIVGSEDTGMELKSSDVHLSFKYTTEGCKQEFVDVETSHKTGNNEKQTEANSNQAHLGDPLNNTMPEAADEIIPGEKYQNHEDDSSSNTKSDEAADELRPEEKLVEILCHCLIPSQAVFSDCGGVYGWHTRVCSALAFGSSVSSYPLALHTLRVFNDLAITLFHIQIHEDKMRNYLLHLSEGINRDDGSSPMIDTEQMYEVVINVVDKLKQDNIAVERTQAFLCMYISRCIDTNSGTELLQRFLMHHAETCIADSEHFSHMEHIVRRCMTELDESKLFDMFTEFIRNDNSELVSNNKHLAAIDAALQQSSECQTLFSVLCSDVIESVVFPRNIQEQWATLDKVTSPDDPLLSTFRAASDHIIAASSNASLKLAVSAAYVRAFLHILSKILSCDHESGNFADHRPLYQNVNLVLDREDSVIFMWYLLQCTYRICTGVKDLTAMERLKWPKDESVLCFPLRVLGNSSRINSELISSLPDLDKDDKFLKAYLLGPNTPTADILNFVEAVAQSNYIRSCCRQLNYADKQINNWLKQNNVLAEPVKTLVDRLTGELSFGVDLLQLSPMSTSLQLQLAAVLIHLTSSVMTKASHTLSPLFDKCLMQPSDEIVKNARDILYSQGNSEQLITAVCPDKFYVCKNCWSKFTVCIDLKDCLLCGKELGATKVPVSYSSSEHFCCTTGQQQIARDILKFVIDGILLCSVAFGFIEPVGVFEVHGIKAEKTDDGLVSLKRKLQDLWMTLEKTLQLTSDEFGLAMHFITDKLSHFKMVVQFSNDIQIKQSIVTLEHFISDEFLKPSLAYDLKMYLDSSATPDIDFRHTALETLYTGSEKVDRTTHLFRQTKVRSLEDLRAQFYIEGLENTHQLVALFLGMAPALSLLQHIMPLLKWSLLCLQLVSYCCSRNECKKRTIEDLLSDRSEKDRKCFANFENSWKQLSKAENLHILMQHNKMLTELHSLNLRVMVQTIILENQDSIVYQVLQTLHAIQNVFLDNVLRIASSGRCPAVGFLKKRPNTISKTHSSQTSDVAAMKCVLLQHVKSSQVINFDSQKMSEDLTIFAQNNLLFGLGRQVCYNFTKIEMELANELVIGKAFLAIDSTFPFVVYANELFVSCASVLQDFKSIIQQVPLGPAVVNGIEERKKNNPDYVKVMMRQTEVLLCVVKKTGGNKEQTIDSYIQSWHSTLPGGFDAKLLPSSGEPLRLSHLVALYVCLENIEADVVIASLNDCFKKPLPHDLDAELKQFMKQFIEKNKIQFSCVETALKRFIVRSLVNFDIQNINLNQSLALWLFEPSLWPETMFESDDIDLQETQETSVTLSLKVLGEQFPKMLNLDHSHAVLECVKNMITENKKQVKWMTAPPKPASSVAAKPVAHGTRSRTKGKLGKT